MPASDCTILERMAIFLSRELRDNEVGAWGVGGILPMAAVRLAQHLHAPGLVIGGERIFNPKPSRLAAGLDDPVLMERAEAIEGFWELFGHWHKGVDFFFYSGMQIDAYGNLNLHVIGTVAAPKLRGPGVANVSLAQSCGRILLYATDHEPRRFVERVDFITTPGYLTGPGAREAAGLPGETGPYRVVTTLGVMGYHAQSKRMMLLATQPGVTVGDVIENTAFKLLLADRVDANPPPDAEELRILREDVDPEGLYI